VEVEEDLITEVVEEQEDLELHFLAEQN